MRLIIDLDRFTVSLSHLLVWIQKLGTGISGEHVENSDLPPLIDVYD